MVSHVAQAGLKLLNPMIPGTGITDVRRCVWLTIFSVLILFHFFFHKEPNVVVR